MVRTLVVLIAFVGSVTGTAQEPRVLPAVAWVDCAPWDGPAFVVAVGELGAKNVEPERAWLRISIWRDAESRHGVTYRFPDNEGKTGIVSYFGSAFPSVTGTVTFARSSLRDSVEGTFDLVAPDGRHHTGRFRGPWRQVSFLCGT